MNVVLHEHSRLADWRCLIAEADLNSISLPAIDELLILIDQFSNKLKDDRRSLVKLGDIHGVKIVAKQPRDKNKRKWMRVLSLFGTAEARKTFTTLMEFKSKGIESLTPVCLLEKKRFGMVVDSWLLYEYREGKESDRGYLPEIVQLLDLLHKNGYRHEDPNFGNFMVDPQEKLFLIDCRGKSRSGRFSDYYDFMLLERCGLNEDEIDAVVAMDKQSMGYRLAKAYRRYIRLRSAYKKMVGRKRSKKQHH